MRDDHVRPADSRDVQGFPTPEFYSEQFVHEGGGRWAVTGTPSRQARPHGHARHRVSGTGNGMEGEVRAACPAITELHRDDLTVSWRSVPARGIGGAGRASASTSTRIAPKA